MNHKGKGSGLALALILIAALLVAFLAVKNVGSLELGSGGSSRQEDYVRQAQGAVNLINRAQRQSGKEP